MAFRILVVDDSDVIRGMLRYVFERMGHTVVADAATGARAVAAFKERRPDLVTLDISLPDMNGLEVLKEMRALDPKAKVVVVTGNNSEALRKDALAGGATAVVLKPFDLNVFKRVLERLGGGTP